ncbi:ANTAR domain-containing protein [Isoptericola sp. CG 20/1183]|uniref:ANTAR domain-containing protein n=1 Tax=Isoptericola halotolerans TaxID=300560 RepID=A0ABX5E9E9_9MICO|nr:MULTISPECIES: PAS and ANTAR domain-containing protein [Isoptericola]MCK0115706.1 PAS and ANTAR domain-containing protein [Isoptericola sp. S6320L]PRZ02651.1 ANTAR domain-containing protein [Isoptericola sp. CG 20/1183]PRZ03003.1 ANTAR domain-containing protein [Isoptericola halotolerans]
MAQTTEPLTTTATDPFVAPHPDQAGPVTAEELASTLAVGTGVLVGRYSVDLETGRWWWSEEVTTIHGYEADEVSPDPDVLRRHQHSDERERLVKESLAALRSGRAFACSHRIVDAHGRTRDLVVTGQARRSRETGGEQVVGYIVDITPVRKQAVEQQVKRAIDAAYVSAAAIERTKGVLMAVHGLDEDAAEAMLVQQAGATGAGLRQTAAQVMTQLASGPGLGQDACKTVDQTFDAVVPDRRPHMREAQLARRRAS